MTDRKKTIIITGSSSGLGSALALQYSSMGNKLFLFGRSKERLEKISDLCRKNGAIVNSIIADVTDEKSMRKHIEEIAMHNNVDVVIACAGVSAGTLDGPETPQQVNKIFSININGVLNTVMPIIPHMIQRKSGNIAIVSSMAGFLGLSSAPSYSASKGAVRLFSEAIGAYLQAHNVYVSTVIPGYIKTPMTDVNGFPMPFMIDANDAAKKIKHGITHNKRVIAFPLFMYLFLKITTLIPSRVVSYINSKLPGKPAFEKK